MRSFFSILFAVLTAIASFFGTSGSFKQLVNKGDISGYAETVSADKDLPDLYTDENGDFTVLQFSDTHFTTGLSWTDISTLRKMEEQITEYKPDLAVISGDMINDGDSGPFNKEFVLQTVSELFEEHEQYWAYIPGNNDGLNYGSTEDIAAYLTQYEHCLVADEKEVSGGAQYSVDIYNGDKFVHSFIFLDTMDYDDDDAEHIYGYVHEDQVKWCENEINSKLNKSKDIGISVFIHENTPNFAKAALEGEAYKDGYAELEEMSEKYNIPKNAPLDELFKNAGCVGLLSMGHSHPDQCRCSFYDNTYYHVTAQTKKMSTLITIHTSAENTREMYDFEIIK